MGIPAVEPLGIVVDRDVYKGTKLDAVLCTYFLEYSTTYRALYSDPHRSRPTDRLLDALLDRYDTMAHQAAASQAASAQVFSAMPVVMTSATLPRGLAARVGAPRAAPPCRIFLG